MAQKRHALLKVFLACAMIVWQPPPRAWKLCSKRLRGLSMQETEALEKMRAAAREAKLAQSRVQRATALTQRRGQATGCSFPAAQHDPAVGAHSPTTQHTQQQALMQVMKCSVLMQQLRSPVTALAR